jgi:hypothetical protein
VTLNLISSTLSTLHALLNLEIQFQIGDIMQEEYDKQGNAIVVKGNLDTAAITATSDAAP